MQGGGYAGGSNARFLKPDIEGLRAALVHFAGSGQDDPKPKRLWDDRVATNGIRASGGQH